MIVDIDAKNSEDRGWNETWKSSYKNS